MKKLVPTLLATCLLAACGGSAADDAAAKKPAATPASPGPVSSTASTATTATDVTPIADCVDAEMQKASGVSPLTSDGISVDGLIFGSGSTGLVFANQLDADLCSWLPIAQLFADKGYRAGVFNYGFSGGDHDVAAMAEELKRAGATSVAFIGASKGGTAVLSAAASAHPSAVVSLSAPTAIDAMNAAEAMPDVTVPTWLGVGEFDADFVDGVRELYKLSPAKHKHLEVVPTGDHGTALLGELLNQVTAFLQTYAPPKP